MKRRIVFALFALMITGAILGGCRSKELCPAYTQANPVEQPAEQTS
jgi:hypothetical protein